MLSSRSSGVQSAVVNKEAPPKVPQERPHATNGSSHNQIMANNNGSAPTAKVQVDEVDTCTIFWEEHVDHCFKEGWSRPEKDGLVLHLSKSVWMAHCMRNVRVPLNFSRTHRSPYMSSYPCPAHRQWLKSPCSFCQPIAHLLHHAWLSKAPPNYPLTCMVDHANLTPFL